MRQNKPVDRLRFLWTWLFTEIIGNAVLALVIASILVVSISWAAGFYTDGWLSNVLAEAHGMVLDILVIGVGITLLNKLSQKNQDIKRYKEEIDDFRRWESDEAAHRIAGSVRRLNNLGVSNIDLRHCFLQNTKLEGAKLEGAKLEGAYLRGAYLRGANLQRANLVEANLQRADLAGANLAGAYLWEADLWGANLQRANLWKADLWKADLQRADLEGAYLRGANLQRADLVEAKLEGANLWEANLVEADLQRANLQRAVLQRQNLCQAWSVGGAKLDAEFRQFIERECPQLLEEKHQPP